ncbi:NAD(P)/FAD-dependent oxidoreductase [Oceanibacterium hippocampi]|uniref:4-methylaminobutanoate oxidase (Formaldehyde-forming) n=1 Tax=Oceanibacterium hippocampi TaxID=745714 RepID=A0A1Y5TXD7_9PROT|nr:FAD-binding oxidoreductase [Oceanibacterium hippocampi]SLN76122.1 4-methylaminobutanoate oxidase (formaldehyde-forming) [Oceanibacterium hippocampi]
MSPPVDPVVPSKGFPEKADVVVVGGGIIGASAAYELAKRGLQVALCEKGRIGAEQSSRNWGYCRQQGRDPAELPLIVESLRIWRSLEAEIGDSVGFHQGGVLYLARDETEVARWEDWLEHARTHQLDTRLLSSRDVDGLVPGGSRSWPGGLWTPSDGRAEPAMAAPAIARAAMRAGASLHVECAVRGIETSAGRVSGVVTERGRIATDAVLCAGGAWSSLFCRRHGISLPQLMIRASVMRTGPGPAITEGGVSTPDFSIRRRQDGGYTIAHGGSGRFDITPDAFRWLFRFWHSYRAESENMKIRFGARFFHELFRSTDWSLDEVSPFEQCRVWDPAPDPAVLERARQKLADAWPILADLRVAEQWAGMIDVTPDAVPVISSVDALPGLFLATGFSGHGFGIGPGAGRLAAELVSGDRPSVDPTPFRFARLADGSSLRPGVEL